MKRPSRPTEGQLKKVGITITDADNLTLKCDKCGSVWSPTMLQGGRLPKSY